MRSSGAMCMGVARKRATGQRFRIRRLRPVNCDFELRYHHYARLPPDLRQSQVSDRPQAGVVHLSDELVRHRGDAAMLVAVGEILSSEHRRNPRIRPAVRRLADRLRERDPREDRQEVLRGVSAGKVPKSLVGGETRRHASIMRRVRPMVQTGFPARATAGPFKALRDLRASTGAGALWSGSSRACGRWRGRRP
jgi:hypothetical protein